MSSPDSTGAGAGAGPGAGGSQAGQEFDPLVGAVIADRYQIVRRIGEGGMGAVYEARHTVIGKRVAVKVLLEKFLQKPDLVARLLQEARLASSIGHENIVDVTDFGTTADGRGFVVMEFLEGESLSALVVREAPLPVERSLRIARQVAGALGAAHAKGIVHRDVKPENVYLVQRGDADFVKVVDFGVSKAVQVREEGFEWQRLTRTGMVLGTPLYMSPEHARGGEDVDSRADVWAVGVMLYECLTGEVPFRASNYLGVISQVLTGEAVPPSQLRPELGIPPAVEALVMRAMDKDRDRRVQTMAELERALERLLGGVAPETHPAPAPRQAPARGPRWHLAVAAVLVVAAGLGIALARHDEGARRRALPAAPASDLVGRRDPAARAAATAMRPGGARERPIPAAAASLPGAPAGTAAPERDAPAVRRPAQRAQTLPAQATRPPAAPTPGKVGDETGPTADEIFRGAVP